ncbi:MAG: SagB family peptide dehydrogenase [Acidimicrobiales bacterium]
MIRRYHGETSHSPRPRSRRHVVRGFRPMDPANRPSPFKRYRNLERQPLPTDLDPPADAPTALEVLSGHRPTITSVTLGPDVLARLLYFSAGVTRYTREGRRRTWFRASASAGNLHPLELYVACGAVSGFDSGLYHVDLDPFALARVRPVDVRAHLAHAVGDPALASAAAVIVVTGIPWRTTWKYAERGWRHVFWDAGSLLANLLAVAAAHGVPARLVFGFMDREVSHILGIDGIAECAVAVVAVGEPVDAEGATAEPSELDELRLEVEPLSPHPLEFPLVTDAQHATDLDGAEALAYWRQACTGEHVRWIGHAAPETLGVPHHGELRDPMETLILRRGSTRLMARRTVPRVVLTWALSAATRPVPADAIPAGRTLLTHELAIHGVEGQAPGLYEWVAGMLERRSEGAENQVRDLATYLCLGQPLGGDSAYTVFECGDLDAIIDVLGPRGYRAAHLEAGIVNGRLLLAAHALGQGATGLTFFDDEVGAAFSTRASCLLVTAVGVPSYRPIPGGQPGRPTELTHFEGLMARLEDRSRQQPRR